jgi:hypothetical protein
MRFSTGLDTVYMQKAESFHFILNLNAGTLAV